MMVLMTAMLPRPAGAFAPVASEWLGSRLPEAVPREAREPLWASEILQVLEERAHAEESAPEGAALLHRFDALRPRLGIAATRRDSVVGLAPYALARAVDDLRVAFRRRNPVMEAAALARIAEGVIDLSDPFLTTPIDPAETAGARAWFGDELAPAEGDDLVVEDRISGDPLAEALALARESAGRRAAVEQAVQERDEVTVLLLRRERLARALHLGTALVRRAWWAGGAPLARAPRPGMRAEPNPASAGTALHFAMPVAGPGRLEIFDLSGRRVIDRRLGPMESGEQRLRVDADWVRELPTGLYLARVSVGTVVVEGRFTRLRP